MGITDGESDMRALLKRSDEGDEQARLAVDIFATAVRKTIGAYAALLGGLDTVVFTGGVGENSAAVRELICGGLGFLGVSAETVKIMKTDEERQIARHCRSLLATQPA
jgi:acetate kinase